MLMRWLRSLNAQLILWAVLPVTFIIIALSFTGVYAHERAMREFATERDIALAEVTATAAEDNLSFGILDPSGQGLQAWLSVTAPNQPGTVVVLDRNGAVLAEVGPQLAEADLQGNPSVIAVLGRGNGAIVIPDSRGQYLMSFSAVVGTGWTVAVLEPTADLTGPLLRFPSVVPVVAVSAGILSILVLTFGWTTIIRPLQQLSGAASQVAWGDYAAISRPVGGVQEVRDLHDAVADMVERIRNYEAAMRDYAAAMTRGQEAERARLARELHDGPVQELVVLGHRAEMAQRLLQRGETERVSEILSELREAEQRDVVELRRLIAALRPAYLEDLGLVPALEMLAKESSDPGGPAVRLETTRPTRRLAADVELAAYRIAQEALNNALAHADATEVLVRLEFATDQLALRIRDDGKGFTLPRSPRVLTEAGHFGLLGMQERANLLGGKLEVSSAPGQGTQVTAWLPARPISSPTGES